MDTCAKCGKELGFFEARSEWNSELKKGYLTAFFDDKNKKYVPELLGQKMCLDCARAVYFEKHFEDASGQGLAQVLIQGNIVSDMRLEGFLQYSSVAAQKYGYILKQQNHFKGSQGGVSLTMIFEKIQETKNVQIVLDFSSLKDVMSKGGLVMTTYKCPNCNGMVELPEAGKVLICKYCGTPIKPVDVFEKIKSLIQ